MSAPLPTQDEATEAFFARSREEWEQLGGHPAYKSLGKGPAAVANPEGSGGPVPLRAEVQNAAPEWPVPINLFAELTAPPFEASDVVEELGAYPVLYARATGIDPSIMLVSAVVAAAGALRDDIQICADSASEWFTQGRLWALVIGAPGSGKTPGQREMLRPLWALHAELDEQWRQAVKGLSDDEPRPPRPRVVLGDVTVEALSEVLAENPRGVLLVTEEFDAWLGAMDQYRTGAIGRDRGEWLHLFDGGPHTIERVKRGSFFISNWGVSILTATTPAAMRRLTRHLPEDGLIQRFIVALAQRQQLPVSPPDRGEIEAAKARYAQTIKRLWALGPRAHKGVVPLSIEARLVFDTWRKENQVLQEALGALDSALEAHIAKYPTLALRLALVFHAARIVQAPDERARDPAAIPVTVDVMRRALAFLRRAEQHALALYLGRKGGSDAYELAQAIARFVLSRAPEENARGLERRDLLRRVSAYKKADERLQAAALRLLIDLGWLREAPGGYEKPVPTRYAVNPQVPECFADETMRERGRRALVRERISEAASERRHAGTAA